MPDHKVLKIFSSSPCILGEGAVIERLRRNSSLELDAQLVNAAFIYSETSRLAQEKILRQYLDIGRAYDLPLLMSTPTWRASRERISLAGFGDRDLNGDNVRALDRLRRCYGRYADKVIVCGLLSCRGNAYAPDEALDADAAEQFHSWQAERLAGAGVDLLLAATLPAISEATGLARALAVTGKPYLISFVVRPEGTLLDGTPLHTALTVLDGAADPPPFAYLINCTHAVFARKALLHPTNSSPLVRQRVIGLLANTAALSPEELDDNATLVEEAPESFGQRVAALQTDLGLRVLGGCCGTDDRHIRALADRLANAGHQSQNSEPS